MKSELTRDPRPFIESIETAPAFWMSDTLWTILVDSESTGGRYSVIEQWMRRGEGPIPHVHEYSDEWFQVTSGTLDLTFDGETRQAKTGDSIWIPRGTVHFFKVTSDECRVLNGYTPGGFEQVLKNLATPASRRELPPDDLPKPDDRAFRLLFNNYWTCEAGAGWETISLPQR